MPEPPEATDRIDAAHGPVQKVGRAATFSLVGLLVAGAAGALFATCAVWQAGAIVQALLQHTEPAAAPPGARPVMTGTPSAPAPSLGPARGASAAPKERAVAPDPAPPKPGASPAAPDPLLATFPPAAEARASDNFERRAEASERVIPLGLEATLSEAYQELTLGEPPPPGFPHTRCDDIFVYIVTTVEGAPLHSAASLGIGKKGPARLRRAGERIGDWTVLAISDDWSGLKPDVWLQKEGRVCRAELAGNPARIHQLPKPRPKPKPKPRPRKRRRR